MASVLYNKLYVDQAAVAAAFSVTDTKVCSYESVDGLVKFMENPDNNKTTTEYLVFDDVYDKIIEVVPETVTLKKMTGAIPIVDMSRANVPKDVLTFLNKHSAELLTIYIGMRDTEGYGDVLPYLAFYKLFSNPEFDIRDGAPFITNAMIRQRMADELAADIHSFTHRGALFLKYGPYVDLRVHAEKNKENHPESIVVYSDNTGFNKNSEVVMRMMVHGSIPGCLSSVEFNNIGDGLYNGEMPLQQWATLMKNIDG